jgi:flagellar biosynthesis chaperone FliJ
MSKIEVEDTVQEIKQGIIKLIQKYQDIIAKNDKIIEEQKSQIKDQENIIKELRAQLYEKSKTTTVKKWPLW